MLLNRRKLRVLKNSTDITTEASSPNTDNILLNLTTADVLYLGWHDKFSSRFFQFNVLNTNSTVLTVQYWDGSSFVAVEDTIDQTVGFTKNGFLSWVNKSNWQKKYQSPITEEELYWIKITVSADLSATTSLKAIMNLFCDIDLLRSMYPEMATDTRYLPPSRTDFLDQFITAKDLVVTRLIQKKVISDESQIVDINQVAIAATHAAAMVILTPIAKSEHSLQLLARARDNFENWLSDVSFSVDHDKSGIISEAERQTITTGFMLRR